MTYFRLHFLILVIFVVTLFSHLGIWLLSLLWLVRQIMFSFLKCHPLGIGPPNFVTSWSRQDIYVYKSYAPVLCTGGSNWQWTQIQVASSLGNMLAVLVTYLSLPAVNPFGMNLHGCVHGYGSTLLNIVTDLLVWECWCLLSEMILRLMFCTFWKA